MKEYVLLRVLKRKNKKDEDYYLAVMAYNSENNCDLVQALISPEQAKKINEYSKDINFDISKYVKIEYNSFAKAYQPKITI